MSFPVSGASWVAELTAVARRCRFKSATVANKGAVDFWLWVCDSVGGATAPSLVPVYVPVNSTQSIDLALTPILMTNGIYVCATTDPATKTLITSNDAFFTVIYEND